MSIQLAMVALDVRDLQCSIEFYRLLGLEIPDPTPDRPGVQCRMASGVSLILVEHFAATSDPTWTRPERGQYQQILEFVADDREGVEELWGKLRDAGNHGRREPYDVAPGIYAGFVDDPDGNAVMISSDQNARPDQPLRP